jgi:hypothetical protein
MLAADRHAVQTDLQAQAVQIKNIELTNIDRYLSALGTQAALVCGFAVAQNYCVELAHTTYPVLLVMYYVTNTACLILEFYCIMNSTMVCVLGPTMALNGPTGSMHQSVSSMKEERLTIMSAFWYGGLCFATSEVFAVWIVTPPHTAIITSVMLVFGFGAIHRSQLRIRGKFAFTDQHDAAEMGGGASSSSSSSSSSSPKRQLNPVTAAELSPNRGGGSKQGGGRNKTDSRGSMGAIEFLQQSSLAAQSPPETMV